MSSTESSVYRLGRGPALLATGAFTIATGVLGFAAFLLADDATGRLVAAVVVVVLAVVTALLALRFALRPPVLARFDEAGFMVTRPRTRSGWKQVDDVRLDGQHMVLTGDATVQVDLALLDPASREPFLREVYDRLNTAHGYTRFG